MRSKVWLLAAAALVSVGLPVGLVPAGAAGETQCKFAFDASISPGLSSQGSSGTFTTKGETGTINCDGRPAGTVSADGKYGTKDPDSCSSGGEGTGVNHITLGSEKVVNNFTFTYGELSTKGGVVSGKFKGDRASGTFEFTPTEGDCFTKPVTKVHVTGEGVLR